jgi:hypothetical protein
MTIPARSRALVLRLFGGSLALHDVVDGVEKPFDTAPEKP